MYTVHSRKSTWHIHSAQSTQPTAHRTAHSTMQKTEHIYSTWKKQHTAGTADFMLKGQGQKGGECQLSNSDIVSFFPVAAWILQCCGHPLLYHPDADPPTHRASAEGLQVGTALS